MAGRARKRYIEVAVSDGGGISPILRESGGPVVLFLSARDCFIRRLPAPRSALPRLDSILKLDIARVTPFAESETLSGWYELAGEGSSDFAAVAQVIARRDMIDPITARLAVLGRRIASILVKDETGRPLPLDLRASLSLPDSPGQAHWRRACAGSAAIAAVLAFVLSGLVFERQASHIDRLSERLHAAEAEAVNVRKAVADIAASSERIAVVRNQKRDAPSPLAIWAELTRLLPDNAWLTGVAVDRSSVTIEGSGQSAEGLIAILDGSPLFEAVAFTGPVTKAQDTRLDRFAIRLLLSHPGPRIGLAAQ